MARLKLPFTLETFLSMILAHSQFLSIFMPSDAATIVSAEHEGKAALCSLILTVFRLDPISCCKSALLSMFLTGFQGTNSDADTTILQILQIFERECGISVLDYAVVWGRGSIDLRSTEASDVADSNLFLESLGLIDVAFMTDTVGNFDLVVKKSVKGYDPRFFLSLFVHLMGQEVDVRRFIEVGGLSLAVMAMASEHMELRQMGHVIVSEAHRLLEVRLTIGPLLILVC